MPGIYAIVHNPTGKSYIGMSGDIHIRHQEHKRDLRKGIHACRPLQELWDTSDECEFSLVVLESFDVGERNRALLKTRELYHINHTDNVLNVRGKVS